jgi:alpha-tubulin suppressor-like RCC1 family protein
MTRVLERSLIAQLVQLWLLSLALSGCALAWDRPERDAAAHPSGDAGSEPDAGTRTDAGQFRVPDARPDNPDAAEDVLEDAGGVGCSPDTCEHGSCNEAGGCECDPEYPFDGERCASPRCAGVLCKVGERCEVEDDETVCNCQPGYTRCGERCVDTQDDREHCGACDFACAQGLGCQTGKCEQRVHALALDEGATCALLEIRSSGNAYPLRCWGRGDFELYRRDDLSASNLPTTVDGVEAAAVIAMSAHRRCIIKPGSEDVMCWGRCGHDCGLYMNQIDDHYRSLHWFHSAGVLALSTADGWDWTQGVGGNTCMLGEAAGLSCVGYSVFITSSRNSFGSFEVRVETFADSPRFIDVSGVDMHTCAVIEDGRVACWGVPDATLFGAESHCPDYQLGGTCTDEQAVAVLVQREGGGALTGALSVRAGSMFSCAVTRDHEVYCWGGNGITGMLGANREDYPQGAVEIAAQDEFEEVAVGGAFACARAASGQVYCWGYRGNVGVGDVAGDAYEGRYFKAPQRVPALPDALNIWAGHVHACARTRSGEVLCWGDNQLGQLGTGDTLPRTTPTPVQSLH